MQRIDNVGWQTFGKQKSENVVAVKSGSLKSYFCYVCWTGAVANSAQKHFKAFRIVWDGECICQDFTFRAEDEAVVLVFGNINTHRSR